MFARLLPFNIYFLNICLLPLTLCNCHGSSGQSVHNSLSLGHKNGPNRDKKGKKELLDSTGVFFF
jgi:hypothetical protein